MTNNILEKECSLKKEKGGALLEFQRKNRYIRSRKKNKKSK